MEDGTAAHCLEESLPDAAAEYHWTLPTAVARCQPLSGAALTAACADSEFCGERDYIYLRRNVDLFDWLFHKTISFDVFCIVIYMLNSGIGNKKCPLRPQDRNGHGLPQIYLKCYLLNTPPRNKSLHLHYVWRSFF